MYIVNCNKCIMGEDLAVATSFFFLFLSMATRVKSFMENSLPLMSHWFIAQFQVANIMLATMKDFSFQKCCCGRYHVFVISHLVI